MRYDRIGYDGIRRIELCQYIDLLGTCMHNTYNSRSNTHQIQITNNSVKCFQNGYQKEKDFAWMKWLPNSVRERGEVRYNWP